MFCPKCGANVPDEIRFCQTCGNDMFAAPVAPVNFDSERTVMAPAPEQSPVAPVNYGVPVPPAAPMQPAYAVPQPPKKSKGPVIAVVIASIVAVAAIVVAVLFGTGVLGDSKKDDEKDEDNKESVTQQVNNNEDEINTTAEEVIVPSKADPVPSTSPAITEAPPTAAPANNDEAEITSVVKSYFSALTRCDGSALRRSLSSYLDYVLAEQFDAASVNALRNDPEVIAGCEEYGIDVNSPDFIYSVYAIGMLEELGGIDNISSISVNRVTLGASATQEELDELPAMMAQDLGVYISSPPSVTAGYQLSAVYVIYYADGTQSTATMNFTALLENGQWRVVPY